MIDLIPFVVFIPILAAIGYFDFKYDVIPNKITYPSAVGAILLNISVSIFSDSGLSLAYILGGGLAAFIFAFVLGQVVSLGGGDIKFVTLIGFMFGYPWFLAPLFGGFALGGLITLATWLAKKGNRERSPFGVYLAISSIVVCGWLIFVISAG